MGYPDKTCTYLAVEYELVDRQAATYKGRVDLLWLAARCEPSLTFCTHTGNAENYESNCSAKNCPLLKGGCAECKKKKSTRINSLLAALENRP